VPIKKGDELVHMVTGMRGTAAADEDGEGMVLLNVQGVIAPYPAREWAPEGAGRAAIFPAPRVRLPGVRPGRRAAALSEPVQAG
jgi:hypothetical protein